MAALQNAVKGLPRRTPSCSTGWGRLRWRRATSILAETSPPRGWRTLNPSRLDAAEQLALVAGQRGDLNLLADVADKTIAAAPRFPGGYVWRAVVEISRNSPDKAEEDLKTAMNVAPKNPQAYLQLGKLRFAQKRFPEGVALLEQTLEYDPNSIEAIRLLVSYDLFQKQPEKAAARLNAQIAKSPNNSGLYDLLTQVEIQNKNLDQAAATVQKAIQLNSGDGEAVMLFAQIQVQRGQDRQCCWRMGTSRLKAHPNDASADAILGTLEESRVEIKGKAETYYEVIPANPTSAANRGE